MTTLAWFAVIGLVGEVEQAAGRAHELGSDGVVVEAGDQGVHDGAAERGLAVGGSFGGAHAASLVRH